MIRIIIIIFLIMSTTGTSWADYELRLNDGAILTWREFNVEGGQYCTLNDVGKFCIQKNDVISIKKIMGEADSADQMNRVNVSAPPKLERLKIVNRIPIAGRDIPTMNPAEFLPGYENRKRRAWLWRLFQEAEQQAKMFVESADRWIVLRRVVPKKDAALWIEDGTIEIDPSFDPGTLFHEIFHTAFHKSSLLAGKDEAWGEAFCDAFRYMMEKQLLPQKHSDWFLKIDKYTTMSYDQIMISTADRAHDQKYGYPASRIVRAAAKNPLEFRRLWFTLLRLRKQSEVDILNDLFDYDMQNGRPY